jgi:hypothetical protein
MKNRLLEWRPTSVFVGNIGCNDGDAYQFEKNCSEVVMFLGYWF